MDTVLVTGGAGFIGSHLISALLEDGWRVRTCGRRPRPTSLSPDVEYVRVDLAEEGPLDELVRGVSRVYHLAGLSSSFGGQEEVERTNVQATENLLSALLGSGVDRVLYMSSSSVYGEKEQLPLPVTEDVEPRPTRGYGAAKRMAEEVVARMVEKGLAATVVRPVTVYGPGNIKLLASAILDAAIERTAGRDHLEVWRRPIRCRLVHIEDVVRACCWLMDRDEAIGQTYNLSSGIYPTSIEIAVDIAYPFNLGITFSDDPDCGMSFEDRARLHQRMVEERGMEPRILLTQERFRFLRKANPNNELSIAKLLKTGFRLRHTDTRRCIAALIDWYRERRWIV